ncbi:MAG: GDP-mannose 4,6-dehydratase [Limisphaerales bacterium]
MTKTALITGITGQDGSYLTDLLLARGYTVHGVVRRTSSLDRSRLQHLYRDPQVHGVRLFLHYADLDDPINLHRTVLKVAPHEVYHLAGQSHVGLSFEIPESTCDLNGMGTLRLLEVLRDLPEKPRLFHAATSEIFGRPDNAPQDEDTPLRPVNPYGCAKAFAANLVRVYREAFSWFAVNGIMYNHESPRRGENFVTRKICRGAAAISLGLEKELLLGDLAAERDWGDARDYVRGMWLALQHERPEDFVFATGRLHSVQHVVEAAFTTVNLEWKRFVRQDARFFRKAEPQRLVGDASKAKRLLGWVPERTLADLIREMTLAEVEALRTRGAA